MASPSPQNLPPNPNLAPNPGQEPLPLPNQEWLTAADDHNELNKIIGAIDQYHRDYNRNFPNGQFFLNDPSSEHAQRQMFAARRKQIEDRMDGVFARGDSSSLLYELELQANNSRREDAVTAQRRGATETAVLDAQRNVNRAEIVYFHHTRRGMDACNANWDATIAAVDSRKKEREHKLIQSRHDSRQGLSGAYESFLDKFRNKEEQALLEANQHIVAATRELDRWSFEGETPDPTREQRVRDTLTKLNQIIDDPNKFSPVDSARAATYAQAVRLRHRIDSRGINEDATQQPGRHRGLAYTADGGIVHRDLNNLITYGDGTVGTLDPSTGRVNRVYADGSRWTDNRPALNVEPRNEPVFDRAGHHVDGNTAFRQWERTHRTEDADLAHAALNFEITQADQRERQLNADLDQANHFVSVESAKLIADISNTARAEGRSLTAEEQREVSRIQTQRDHLRRQIPALESNLAAHRGRVNVIKYRKNFLEVDRQRQQPEQPPRSRFLGRIGLRGNVQQAPGNLPPAPILNTHSGIVADGLYLNGRPGNWTVWPDGTATLGEITATGKRVFYDRQGKQVIV